VFHKGYISCEGLRLNFLFRYYAYVHCLERPSPKWPILYVSGGMLNPTHSCTHELETDGQTDM